MLPRPPARSIQLVLAKRQFLPNSSPPLRRDLTRFLVFDVLRAALVEGLEEHARIEEAI
jgi:hypothetical protein